MGLLWLVGSIKLCVSVAKEPHKIDNILQKRLIIVLILTIVATPCIERLSVGCNNEGGGGNFSKVKRLVAKSIGTQKRLFTGFLVAGVAS